jgi:uncharacterized protein with PIN domain
MSAAPKFLCDAMLAHLGRRLRMAGYDTAIADGSESDHELVLRCQAEGRLLLSADRQMQERKAAEGLLVFLPTNNQGPWVRLLAESFQVEWLKDPFSRCLECNHALLPLPDQKKIELVPEGIRNQEREFRYCPVCDKAYWQGSHVDRMRRELQKLENESA